MRPFGAGTPKRPAMNVVTPSKKKSPVVKRRLLTICRISAHDANDRQRTLTVETRGLSEGKL
jgi:hypothetical protein